MRNHKVGASPDDAERRDAAEYVAAMCRDLGALASRSRLATLAYLLDMARLEAETAARDGAAEPELEKGVDAS